MPRKKKPRRRKVYSIAHGFHDGAVFACGPERKPSEKRIKEEGIYVCPDGVFKEDLRSPTEWQSWDVEQRVKTVTILANRLNTRRAIRELVLPELEEIQNSLVEINERLKRLEHKASV
ncbi:MAG: hypothetical protein AAFN77_15520 [Planctomycetota bacterium]